MKLTRRQMGQIAAMGVGAAALGRSQSATLAPGATTVFPNQEGLTLRVAEFVANTKYEDIPKDVIELGRKSILDGLGLALVGSVAESGKICREYLQAQGFGSTGATVIGSKLKAPPRFAAFANGVGIHADDYDDTQLAVAPDRVYGLLTHPTAPCFSAALAVAESKGISGHDLMHAYQLGVEVECKISEAINPRHYQEGFHSTGTVGTFASAAAAMKLRGADSHAIARALGLAASQASGLRENFGTMTKPYHAGHAAEGGIAAADFVMLGWTVSERILEAPSGFFRAAGGGFDPGAITPGKPWTFANPGVSIKPFPSGSLTHPGMTELRRMLRNNNIKTEMVDRLDVGTNKYMPTALIHHKPMDSLQAKFSMEFCMSSLLLYGRAGLNEFKDEVVRRQEVQDMIKRVNFHVHPVAEAAGYNKMTTILDLHLKDGRTISGKADFALGSPADPMSFDDVAAKFEDGARFANWPTAKAAKIIETVRKFEEIKDIRTLTALLQA
ncbi:MAG: MmgE/PrpD family protein [Bryobacteraceae bacterium]